MKTGGRKPKKRAGELTYRRILSCGLIAGLRTEEINRMKPGMVLDLYGYRQMYDAGRM